MTMARFERNALPLILLIISSLVSYRRLVSAEMNFNSTSNSTEMNTVPYSNFTKEIGTDPNPGSESNSTTTQQMNHKTVITTESPPNTHLPVTNGSGSTTSSPDTASVKVTPKINGTMLTNDSVSILTTRAGLFTTRTTVQHVSSTTTSTTIIPTKRSTTPKSTTQSPPCPTHETKKDNIVSRCLIIIAVLAAVTIIFIITTVVLAAKLSSRYRNGARLLRETEMVCISALMNDTDHPLPHPKHPKSNGALIPNTEDDDGDDLTLNSFLPDAEGGAQS